MKISQMERVIPLVQKKQPKERVWKKAKDIAEYFEHNFDIDLGQYRRTFLEIRARKSERTKFITALNDTLIKRMDNSDDII